MRCDHCSRLGFPKLLRDDTFNLPQPGYIGANYENTRVLLVGQNPGVSPDRFSAQDREFADAQIVLRNNANTRSMASLKGILEKIMPTWPVVNNYFPLAECGLSVDDIAYVNAVRCRTEDNAPPGEQIAEACVSSHFVRWLDWLNPRVVVCIGKWAHDRTANLLEDRSIPHEFVNRRRSLSGADRLRNKEQVVALVRRVVFGECSNAPAASAIVGADEGQLPNSDRVPATTPQRGLKRKSTINAEGYIELLSSLGYLRKQRPNDGRLLRHKEKTIPRLYFNMSRERRAYFVGYKTEEHYLPASLWERLSPQKKTDDRPDLMTIVPRAGREREAFGELLNG